MAEAFILSAEQLRCLLVRQEGELEDSGEVCCVIEKCKLELAEVRTLRFPLIGTRNENIRGTAHGRCSGG